MEDPGFSLGIRMARDLGARPGGGASRRGRPGRGRAGRGGARGARERTPAAPGLHRARPSTTPPASACPRSGGAGWWSWPSRRTSSSSRTTPTASSAYDGPPPPSLWRLAADVDGADEHVIRLGSFSKTLSPGLRCGWLTSGPGARAAVHRARRAGQRRLHEPVHVPGVRAARARRRLRRQRRAPARALRGAPRRARERPAWSLPEGCGFARPGGGLFLLVTLPPGLASGDLVAAGEANGVGFMEGTRFAVDGPTAASAWGSACTPRTSCARARRARAHHP